MKYASLGAALLALSTPFAGAVELNTDTLKTMQEQGHEIVAQEEAYRSFRASGDRCMQIAGPTDKVGANLGLSSCKADAKNQELRFDEKSRLVSRGGTCVGVAGDPAKQGANVVMQECSGDKTQTWKLDGDNRLSNGMNKCLQARGKPDSGKGNVVSANCGKAANLVWE